MQHSILFSQKARHLLVLFILAFPLLTVAQSPPNIIVFLVDDMGWQDTSVPFWKETTPLNRRFHTPNMERLAAEGVKFTNAYATPVCTPTRVSLMTGMNVSRHRVSNWTSPYPNQDTSAPDSVLNAPAWNYRGMSQQKDIKGMVYAKTLAQVLKDNGYYTIHTGKAHFGAKDTPGENPVNMGFDVNIAGNMTGHPQSFLGESNYGNLPGKTTIHAVPGLEKYHGTDTFLSEALTLEAMDALVKPTASQQPFFLYMAHYAVHLPFDKDKRYFQKYVDAGLEESEAAYAALIEGMDKSLGDLMDFLKEKKLDKNTIILFMSDNGGFSFQPQRMGADYTQNSPLAVGKGSVHEGGIREPMLLKWPGHTQAGTVSTHPVIIEDFFPTILHMANIKRYEVPQVLDGQDFSTQFTKGKAAKKLLVWHYPNKWGKSGPGISFHSAMRKGKWKLIYDHKTEKLSLYNLDDDIGEQYDLSKANPKITRKLADDLSQYLRQREAQMPYNKPLNRLVSWPDEAYRASF
jgi:arylsulfatase A-like enzyme